MERHGLFLLGAILLGPIFYSEFFYSELTLILLEVHMLTLILLEHLGLCMLTLTLLEVRMLTLILLEHRPGPLHVHMHIGRPPTGRLHRRSRLSQSKNCSLSAKGVLYYLHVHPFVNLANMQSGYMVFKMALCFCESVKF